MAPVHAIPWDVFFSLDKFLYVQRNFEYVSFVTPVSDWRIPLIISSCYLLSIFVLRKIMNQCANPLPIKWISALHNLIMFVISVACFFGQAYGLYDILSRNNWSIETLYCDAGRTETLKGPMYFWVYLFSLSKFYELADTLMLVFKKSRLRFLHVYHHWATGILCFCCLMESIPIQWIATLLNALVHIPMYYYYFVVDAAPGTKVWWKEYITQMQIIQFITVNIVHWSALVTAIFFRDDCISYWTFGNLMGFIIVNSYLFLFIKLYIDTYTRPKAVGSGKTSANGKTPANGQANGASQKAKKDN